MGEVESISKFELQAFGSEHVTDFEPSLWEPPTLRFFEKRECRVEPGRPRRQFEQDVLLCMNRVYAEDLATTGISSL